MAVAKQQKVKAHNTGKTILVECTACYDEFGSQACVRPAHGKSLGKMVRVVQDEEKPVTKEVLATAITQISEAVRKLEKSGLNQKAIVALINDDTKLGKGLIETVLISLRDLAKTYTK